MRTFSELFEALDTDNSTNGKLASLRAHFASAPPEDAAWALYFLCGERLPSAVSTRTLRLWAGEAAGVAPWLFEECYAQVGDLAETIALLLPDPAEAKRFPLSQLVEERVRPLAEMTPAEQAVLVRRTWAELGAADRFLYNKLLAGSFRVGVQKTLVTKALAETAGLPASLLAGRLLGKLSPHPGVFPKPLPRRGTGGPGGAARPLFPGLAAGRTARKPRPTSGLAGRMEIRRHPRPAHPFR